jgi:TonB family protein
MAPQRWLLAFTFVAVLVLVILDIRNHGPELPRPVPQRQTSSSFPKALSPLPAEAAKPAPPPTAKFGIPIFGNNPNMAENAGSQLVRVVRPQYTEAALNAHYEGQVKVNFIIRKDGRAHDIESVNSPGYGMDQNIIEAVKDWLWIQGFQEDHKFTITIVFKLDH